MDKMTANKISQLNKRMARIESIMLAESAAEAYELTGNDRSVLVESVAERAESTGKPVTMHVINELAEGTKDRRDIFDKVLGPTK